MLRSLGLFLVATTFAAPAASAQAAPESVEVPPEERIAAAKAIRLWVNGFAARKFAASGTLLEAGEPGPAYCAVAREAGLLRDNDIARLTHLDVLQRLLFFAEANVTENMADAVLKVAAVGLDRSLLDRQALEVRELGHWTMMRIKDQGAWFLVLRAAAGERIPVLEDLRPEDAPKKVELSPGPARRVAALRMLGQRNLPVFRSTLEAAITSSDPRVRLAAIEALPRKSRLPTIECVSRAMLRERHPIVSQALVQRLLRMLQRPPKELADEYRRVIVRNAVGMLGRSGWRTDLDILDIVEAFPDKTAIPYLIRAMERQVRSPDKLVAAVNKQASPILNERAGMLLRAMTGALVPYDDAAAWRGFWAREEPWIKVPEKLATQKPAGTRAAFFGVPVTGSSIAFLTDTSGSMGKRPAKRGPITGPKQQRSYKSRLHAAKYQLALATQAMPRTSQYYVMTFADKASTWTKQPLRANHRSARKLSELLGRLNAHGGTNLYAGLVAAFDLEERRFGGQLPKIDELFVLSDGKPTTGQVKDTETLLQMVREANQYAKIRINTVFTGTGKGAELLRRLADENGGVFVQR